MSRSIKTLFFFWLAVFLSGAARLQEADINFNQDDKALKESWEQDRLSSEDKDQLAELLRLKQVSGDLAWPAFGETNIPLLQYNERYEFLVLHPDPPPSWEVVEGDTFQNRSYFRRRAEMTEAFAVRVGGLWAGSLDTFGSMNRAMKEQLKKQISPEKLTPAFLKMMSIRPAHHVVALLHEAFHAFQAVMAHGRFKAANSVYSLEKEYPFGNEDFQSAWKREGELLASALRTRDEAERQELIRKFLETRTERRQKASLSAELVSFERELEWLEGLAKYVEMRFAELGSSGIDEERSRAFRIVKNRLQMDFYYRLMKLSDQRGDLRFYLSGAALAMLLDKTSPGWKKNFLDQDGAALEDLF